METSTISIIDTLINEMNEQAAVTKQFMASVPEDKYDWAPHEKSMKLLPLASHIAELPSWVSMALTTDELDFEAQPYEPASIKVSNDLMRLLDESVAGGRAALEKATEEQLQESWTLRSGEHIHSVSSKLEVIRMAFNQIVHHRAQLGVYFRLLGIPVPQSFGPTADSQDF